MKRMSMRLAAVGILALLVTPASYLMAQDGEEDTAGHDALHARLEAQHEAGHDLLRDQHAALLERLKNADLRPAQKRRIYNALTDRLEDRHEGVHDRLRRIHDRAHDARTDRPLTPRTAGPDTRPRVPALGTPGRTPPQARPGLRVARLASRR